MLRSNELPERDGGVLLAYRITNHANGYVYIGVTARTVRDRWYAHKSAARRGRTPPLYEAMRQYGLENFTIEAIACTRSLSESRELESVLIAQHESLVGQRGYNATVGGEVVTDTQRWRMSDAHAGVPLSREHAAAIGNGNRGKKYTPWTEEARRRVGDQRRGKKRGPRPEWVKRKISEAKKGSRYALGRLSHRRKAVMVGEIGHPSKTLAAQFHGVTLKTIDNWIISGRARFAA